MGKAAIIVVIGAFIIFFTVSRNINNQLGSATDYSVDFFSEIQARNVANSTAEMLLARLGDNTSYRESDPIELDSVWEGNAEYTITDTVLDGEELIKISVIGSYYGTHQTVTVYTYVPEKTNLGFSPFGLRAAISTNNPVQTLGTITVDGRNHDTSGNLIPGTGTLGIWTTSSYNQGGASKIGGTDGGTDYVPKKKYESSIVAEGQTFPGGYPDTPDSVFGGSSNGYPPGTLAAIAKTGALGSQYVTDPDLLTYPLSGVTFVELPAAETWNGANITGEGVLIVHNSSLDAALKNVNTGPFKGILIADDIEHIHCDIIGAIMVLSPDPPSGNCIGNGKGKVLYSSQTVAAVTEDADPTFIGRHGFNRRRMPIVHWAE